MIVKRLNESGVTVAVSDRESEPRFYTELAAELDRFPANQREFVDRMLSRPPAVQLSINIHTAADKLAAGPVSTVIPDGLTSIEIKASVSSTTM